MITRYRIPFVHAAFPDPSVTVGNILERFQQNWRLRHIRGSELELRLRNGGLDDDARAALIDDVNIPYRRSKRMTAKAGAAFQRYRLKYEITRLAADDAKRLEPIRTGVDLVQISSEHRADEIAAELQAEYPWHGRANEIIWRAMRRSYKMGEPGLRLPPILLVGPPGIGKSHWARSLAEKIGVPGVTIDAGAESAGFAVTGVQKGWSNAMLGRPMETVLQTLVANPIFIVDEIEKAGRAKSSKGHAYGMAEALLPLLERSTAAVWNCPYFRLRFDFSWISWILTANDIGPLPLPLISRCQVVELPIVELRHLTDFIAREGAKRGLSKAMIDVSCEALTRIAPTNTAPSLRTALRLIESAEFLSMRPVSH